MTYLQIKILKNWQCLFLHLFSNLDLWLYKCLRNICFGQSVHNLFTLTNWPCSEVTSIFKEVRNVLKECFDFPFCRASYTSLWHPSPPSSRFLLKIDPQNVQVILICRIDFEVCIFQKGVTKKIEKLKRTPKIFFMEPIFHGKYALSSLRLNLK